MANRKLGNTPIVCPRPLHHGMPLSYLQMAGRGCTRNLIRASGGQNQWWSEPVVIRTGPDQRQLWPVIVAGCADAPVWGRSTGPALGTCPEC